MLDAVRDWFGVSSNQTCSKFGHGDVKDKDHGHTHGVIDPAIATTERGIWAILAVTAGL